MESIQSTRNVALAVEGAIEAKCPIQMMTLAGSVLKNALILFEDWNAADLFVKCLLPKHNLIRLENAIWKKYT